MTTAFASTSVDMTASTSVDTNLKREPQKKQRTTKAPAALAACRFINDADWIETRKDNSA